LVHLVNSGLVSAVAGYLCYVPLTHPNSIQKSVRIRVTVDVGLFLSPVHLMLVAFQLQPRLPLITTLASRIKIRLSVLAGTECNEVPTFLTLLSENSGSDASSRRVVPTRNHTMQRASGGCVSIPCIQIPHNLTYCPTLPRFPQPTSTSRNGHRRNEYDI
jgi:hypothetical protein